MNKLSPLHNTGSIQSSRTLTIKAYMKEFGLTRPQAESRYDKEKNALIIQRFKKKSV